MKLVSALALAALLSTSCATRVMGGVYPSDDGGVSQEEDLTARPADLSRPRDASWPTDDMRRPRDMGGGRDGGPRDMASAGKTCGEIVLCAVNCGLQLGLCQLQCFEGASGEALQEAAALIACGAQKCLGADAGGTTGMITCMLFSCSSEIAKCGGLGF